MAAPTNKPQSNPAQTQQPIAKPKGDYEGSFSEIPEIVWSELQGGFLNAVYELDGKYGWAMTNGELAVHFDTQNNIIFTAGAAGPDGACGGKMISSTKGGKIDKHSSVSIEVTGRTNDGSVGKKENTTGGIEETKIPAYSLKVYGDVLIECVGGEVAIKGDNVTLNANSTLNLKSGKDINLETPAGGRINFNTGAINLNAATLNKTLTAGEYSKGAGEVQIDQYNPGAVTSVNTPGNVKYTVNGNYEVGVTGDYKSIVNKNYSLSVGKNSAFSTKGNRADEVLGKMKLLVSGVTQSVPPSTTKENYVIQVGPTKTKSPSVLISTGSNTKISALTGGFQVEVAKKLATLNMNEKEVKMQGLPLRGSLLFNEKEAKLSFGVISKVALNDIKVDVKATSIFLN